MLKTCVLTASLSMFASLAGAAEGGVAGSYNVTGKNPDGSPYTGTAEIRATSEDTCTIAWKLGVEAANGVCVRHGNLLAAGWQFGDKTGAIILEIKDDGSMVGVWTLTNETNAGTEVLTPKH